MIKNRQLSQGQYATHFAPLIAAVMKTKNIELPVIEFGMGDFSTLLLHEILKGIPYRVLLSYESDLSWVSFFEDLQSEEFHHIYFIQDWDEIPVQKASVVLIDHAPAERRIIDIHRFAFSSQIIVVHDTDKPDYYGYTPVFKKFKYVFKYERYAKSTTLLSNFIDVTKII